MELPGRGFGMHGDQLQLFVVNTHQVAVPAHPDFSSQIFRRRRVVGFGDFNMTVPIDLAFALTVEGETLRSQRQESWAFNLFEVPANLLTGSAMDASISYLTFPVSQELVMFLKTGKHPAL